MLESDRLWMFNPDDKNLVNSRKRYASKFDWVFEWDDGPDTVSFEKKGNMEFNGAAEYNPSRSGDRELIATVAEYSATKECREPEIMILEVGSADEEDGGHILFLVGNALAANELQVYSKGQSSVA
jgi:hypothetical protein